MRRVVPLILPFLIVAARGAPGDIDTSFNANANEAVLAFALQPDGKLVAGGGFTSIGGATRSGFARLNASGTADTTFAGPPFLDTTELSQSCAVLADGKILSGRGVRSAPNTPSNFARFTAAGVVDTTFNAPLFSSFCMLIQDDNKITAGGNFRNVAGSAGRWDYLLRLNPGGPIDSTFTPRVVGVNAIVITMAVQPDGKILLGGDSISSVGGVTRNLIARINADGTLDTTFTANIGGNNAQVHSLAVQPDGKIIVGGNFTTVSGQARRMVARLNSNGSIDTSFSSPFTAASSGYILSSAILTDGHIAIGGGFEMTGPPLRNGFVMLNADGTIDTAFSPAVIGTTTGMAVQTDGKIIRGGSDGYLSGSTQRNGLVRVAGFPATQALEATSGTRLRWMRGGGSHEVLRTRFELSTDGGAQWTSLGEGVRIAGGWEKTGLTLPLTGRLRARAVVPNGKGNGSQGWLETVVNFTRVPEIAVHNGPGVPSPELTDGQTQSVDFGTTRQGTPQSLPFTIFNSGSADLNITGVTAPAGFSFTSPLPFPAAVAPGQALTLQLQLMAAASGSFTGMVNISSDDASEGVFNFPVAGLVITPEIALHDGPTTASPQLADGQAAAVDFGTTRQTNQVIRSFTVANTGTAPLLLSAATVPAGFSIYHPVSFPVTIEPNQTGAFDILLTAAAAGTFTGTVTLTSDDLDESVFDFPVTATVVTPEIAVHDGALTAPELTAGQTTPVNFGRNVQGTPATRSFTIANTGTAELRVNPVSAPPGYTLTNLPASSFLIGTGQSVTFQVSLTTIAVGTHAGSLSIRSDDVDEPVFDFPLTGEVFIPDPVASVTNTATALNRQTGLHEQTIHIANDTTATVPAYNIIIRGLPAGVEVNNASETRADGSVVIYIRSGLSPRESHDIILEYYSADRSAVTVQPQVSTEVVLTPADLTVPEGESGLAIETVKQVAGGALLLEFTSVPGKRYQVQYSTRGLPWQNSLPLIRAAGSRTQWIDRGLPRTDAHPALATGRLYRVREVQP